MSNVASPGAVLHHRFGFVRDDPLLSCFILTFALSWTGMLSALLLSAGGLSATPEQLLQPLALALGFAGMLLSRRSPGYL